MTELTVGELAKRAGMRASALRYYEQQGLLQPTRRSHSGYRLYDPAAEETLRFIQRAQRIGFSLEDIKALLAGLEAGGMSDESVLAAAEERYVAMERRLTEMLVTRHELERFLLDLSQRLEDPDDRTRARYERLILHVCGHDDAGTQGADMTGLTLNWLLERTGCALGGVDADELVAALSGVHVHVWQRDTDYCILVPSQSPEVERALRELARIEAECHAHPAPTLTHDDQGWLFVAEGDDAYLFAQFFLTLEQGSI